VIWWLKRVSKYAIEADVLCKESNTGKFDEEMQTRTSSAKEGRKEKN